VGGDPDPDVFVVINIGKNKKVSVHVRCRDAKPFGAFRTTEDEKDR
jgi:hypothetical protein